jgi:hypothetical protein
MGTTFLWTEHYGVKVHRGRERFAAVAFVVAVVALAAGAAGLVTLQGPYALVDSVRTALGAL